MKKAAKPSSKSNRRSQTSAQPSEEDVVCPFVVGIGSSAGGLEALEAFFMAMNPRSGLAFVVVSHQHAGHTSLLPELLAEKTDMPVVEASSGLLVEPNHVYVAPPGGKLALLNGTLQIFEPTESPHLCLRIDHFFRSLAQDQRERAVCIILSGTGTDGTLGLKEVKGESGMAMVQEVRTAQYTGMPSSAIATGLVDYVLPPDKMPEQLLSYVSGPFLKLAPEVTQVTDEPLQQIFVLLRDRTGHDFSNYKTTTIRRRIERRLNVHQIEDPSQYVRFAQENPSEIDLLFKELLISVTSFFRDPKAFEALGHPKTGILSKLILALPQNAIFRAWIPGCATGEEPYSLAILLREIIESTGKHLDVQIFATDLDEIAIHSARAGIYPEAIAADVGATRLDRYFVRKGDSYQVCKEIREMVTFAPQNLIKDPPFTKLDLITCRNVLIYLNAKLQKRLLPILHYALKPGGLLFLGPSETVGQCSELFHLEDKRWKIYSKIEATVTGFFWPEVSAQPVRQTEPGPMNPKTPDPERSVPSMVTQTLLSRFCPPSILCNNLGEIFHIHGRTGDFLEPSAGQPRMNVLEMAREGLELELASALRRAGKETDVTRENVRIRKNGGFTTVHLSVTKLLEPEPVRGLYLVSFLPVKTPKPKSKTKAAKAVDNDRVKQLEEELQHSKESLQTTIEELQTSNEELKSANEELQSTNEELQSTNEEMETSKEELQSLNEELTTVNNELESKMQSLGEANDDMLNLLNSTSIATVFLDNELKIKRYTEEAKNLINLIPTDIGRPIVDLSSHLLYTTLVSDCQSVLKTLAFREKEVETDFGGWYLMRIGPYRTSENVISGLVITFFEISQTYQQRAFFESIVQTVGEPLVVLDEKLQIVSCNSAFCDTFQNGSQPIENTLIYEIGSGQWNHPELRRLLEKVLPENKQFENLRVEADFPDIGHKTFIINGRQLEQGPGQAAMILLAMRELPNH